MNNAVFHTTWLKTLGNFDFQISRDYGQFDLIQVFKLEVFALEVPTAGFNTEDDSLEFNCLLRYALGVTTYLAVLTLQILFNRLIYEPYVENKIQQFIDLCTLSNISVWLLTEKRYGFYIHGRYLKLARSYNYS